MVRSRVGERDRKGRGQRVRRKGGGGLGRAGAHGHRRGPRRCRRPRHPGEPGVRRPVRPVAGRHRGPRLRGPGQPRRTRPAVGDRPGRVRTPGQPPRRVPHPRPILGHDDRRRAGPALELSRAGHQCGRDRHRPAGPGLVGGARPASGRHLAHRHRRGRRGRLGGRRQRGGRPPARAATERHGGPAVGHRPAPGGRRSGPSAPVARRRGAASGRHHPLAVGRPGLASRPRRPTPQGAVLPGRHPRTGAVPGRHLQRPAAGQEDRRPVAGRHLGGRRRRPDRVRQPGVRRAGQGQRPPGTGRASDVGLHPGRKRRAGDHPAETGARRPDGTGLRGGGGGRRRIHHSRGGELQRLRARRRDGHPLRASGHHRAPPSRGDQGAAPRPAAHPGGNPGRGGLPLRRRRHRRADPAVLEPGGVRAVRSRPAGRPQSRPALHPLHRPARHPPGLPGAAGLGHRPHRRAGDRQRLGGPARPRRRRHRLGALDEPTGGRSRRLDDRRGGQHGRRDRGRAGRYGRSPRPRPASPPWSSTAPTPSR